MTWVKGHATPEHIRNGVATERDAHLNRIADATAERAHESHQSLVSVCNRHQLRFDAYVRKMLGFWQMYATILRAHDELVSERKQAENESAQRDTLDGHANFSIRLDLDNHHGSEGFALRRKLSGSLSGG